jgi:predicted glutamine amidotransferase
MDTTDPYIAHFRYATKGALTKENIHPFRTKNYLLFLNGTISGFADEYGNDARQLADTLPFIKKRCIPSYLASFDVRCALVDRETGKVWRTGDWMYSRDLGMFFSKHGYAR